MDPRQPIIERGETMTIDFYKCADDQRTVYKNLTDKKTVTAQIKDDTNLIRPLFWIVYDADLLSYNYLQAAGRSYYIESITAGTGGQLGIQCRVDVLMTYADQIMQCPVIVDRSANRFNTFLMDPQRRFYQYTTTQYVTLGDVGAPSSVVMVTVG